MDNYYYIIAGLPELTNSFDETGHTYEKFSSDIRAMLSEKDNRLVDWLEYCFDENHLSSHYYRQAHLSKNNFINNYITFDKDLRNILASLLAKSLNKNADDYIIGEPNLEIEELNKIKSAYETKNIIEREKIIDRIRWEKINEIICFEYFSIDNILAFLAKLKIVDRWAEMDKAEGAKLFEQFVQEVRGTFKGINK